MSRTETVNGVLVHYDPPVPANVRGPHCGELGGEHVDVRTSVWTGGGVLAPEAEPHASVEVYLAGYAKWGDTYRRSRDRVVIRPPGTLRRLFGATFAGDVNAAIRSRANIVRRLRRDIAEVEALRLYPYQEEE